MNVSNNFKDIIEVRWNRVRVRVWRRIGTEPRFISSDTLLPRKVNSATEASGKVASTEIEFNMISLTLRSSP